MNNGQRSRQPSLAAFQVRRHKPDYGLLVIASILLVIGLVIMYAISPALAAQGGDVGKNYFVTKQFIAIILGFVAFFVAAKLPLSLWEKWQKPLLILSLFLSLVAVLTNGIGGRWIMLGNLSFQPVELVKFALIIYGAVIFAKASKEGLHRLTDIKPLIISFILFSVIIIALQRDLGSVVILSCILLLMAFLGGVPLKKLLIIFMIGVFLGVAAIGSTAYRRERLLTYFQPERDCTDAGYHACQALIAVGSGGVLGVGLGRSVQAYGYLPEAENDSIFAIYAEKFGFVGVVVLIGLIGALLLRILNIMQRAPNKTAQLVCAGIFAWLASQSMVNIGAMIGLLPLKGITLPFISYGGTSLIFVMLALGVVFQISGYSSMRKSSISYGQEGGLYESSHNWRRNSRTRHSTTSRSY